MGEGYFFYIFINCKREFVIPMTQVKCNKKIMTITLTFGGCSFVTNQVDFSSIPCELIKIMYFLCIFQHRFTQRFLIFTYPRKSMPNIWRFYQMPFPPSLKVEGDGLVNYDLCYTGGRTYSSVLHQVRLQNGLLCSFVTRPIWFLFTTLRVN